MAPPVRWEPPPGMPPGVPQPLAPEETARGAPVSSSSKRRRDYEDNDEDNNHDRSRRDSERGYPRDPSGQSGGGSVKQQRRGNDAPDYYGRGRDIRRDRDGRSSFSRFSSGDERWRCPECRYSNHPYDEVCRECGARERYSRNDGRMDGSFRKQRSISEGSSGENKYMSDRMRSDWRRGDDRRRSPPTSRREGDRDDRRAEPGKRQKKKDKVDEKRWPPPFESDGASYIFDARSGLFYEGRSDFFYDPKSKLYYGNKEGTYFQYCPEQEPPYRAMNQQPAAGQSAGAVISTATSAQAKSSTAEVGNNASVGTTSTEALPSPLTRVTSGKTSGGSTDKKNKIAICLKKKPSATGSSDSNKSVDEVVTVGLIEKKKIDSSQPKINSGTSGSNPGIVSSSQTQKMHQADMEKWSVRVKEMRGDTSGTDNAPTATASQTKTPEVTKQPVPQSSVGVTKTKTGHPICTLCKRKFADVEKLRQHERVSALHKQNLAKKAAAEAQAAKEEQAMEYRDRAKERRFLYGPDPTVSIEKDAVGTGTNSSEARAVNATEIVKPGENLGDTNIGNQLLQKLGWKAGNSLGRKQQGGDSVSNEGAQQPQAPGTADHLRQDWERIESMAGGMNPRQMGVKGREGVGGRIG